MSAPRRGDDPLELPRPAALVADHFGDVQRYYRVLRRTREPDEAMRCALDFALAREDYAVVLQYFRGEVNEHGPELRDDLLTHLENQHRSDSPLT